MAALRKTGFEIGPDLERDILAGKDFVQIKTGPFDVDLVFAPDGISSFVEAQGALTEGIFRVAHLRDIIASKRASGRQKDLVDLPLLESFALNTRNAIPQFCTPLPRSAAVSPQPGALAMDFENLFGPNPFVVDLKAENRWEAINEWMNRPMELAAPLQLRSRGAAGGALTCRRAETPLQSLHDPGQERMLCLCLKVDLGFHQVARYRIQTRRQHRRNMHVNFRVRFRKLHWIVGAEKPGFADRPDCRHVRPIAKDGHLAKNSARI